MKRKHGVFFGFAALLIAAMFAMAGCDSGGGGDGDDGTRAFSVSGSFTKSTEAGGGTVNFDLKSDGDQGKSTGRAVTADSYTLSGVLEDGAITMRLRGNYDPNTGRWSVSAKSSLIIYTLNGSVDSAGVSQGISATIAVKSGEEWIPYFFPVTEASDPVTATEWDDAGEDATGGVPSIAQGYWHSNHDSGGGYTQSISILISAWKTAVSGTATTPYGNIPIDESWTLLEIEDKGSNVYEVIGCYPDYVKTSTDLASAVGAYLGVTVTGFSTVPDFNAGLPSGKWVYVESPNSSWWGGFTEAEFARLDVFWGTGRWEKWAASNGVSKVNKYIKGRMTYTSPDSFDMVNLVGVANSSQSWIQTYDFPTLADLKAATLVEERDYDFSSSPPKDIGPVVMTFTR
jgi:hypothetical protein